MDDLELKENSPQGQDGALGVEESCKELTRYLEDILRDAPHARLEAERRLDSARGSMCLAGLAKAVRAGDSGRRLPDRENGD